MSDLIQVHVKHLRAAGRAEMTIDARERLLDAVDEWLPFGLDNAHPDELAEFFAWPDWSAWTRSTYWSHLQGYYRWMVRRGDLAFNPLDQLDRPNGGESLPDPVTDDEWSAATQRSPDQPWLTLIMLCSYAGLRAGEACRLTREDVTQDQVRVRGGKGARDAYVPTAPALWEFLKDRPPGHLARSVKGLTLQPKSLTSNQHVHWRRIGLPAVHLHRFRHWYGTALLAAGTDIRVIQELMRHKSIQSTQGYTRVVSEQRRLAICTLPTPATVQQSTAA